MTGVLGQLDLFAQAAPELGEREQWAARFERADWIAPWDCSGGLRKGESVLGWVCPACGVVEISTHILQLNHGYGPARPGSWSGVHEFGASCTRLTLLASQEASRLAREAKAARAAA